MIGLRPPRPCRKGERCWRGAPKPNKGELVLELIKRPDGASLPELVTATGWLAHTTRAAICRLRKAGQAITRSQRSDGTGTYRILPPEAVAARSSRRRAEKTAAA